MAMDIVVEDHHAIMFLYKANGNDMASQWSNRWKLKCCTKRSFFKICCWFIRILAGWKINMAVEITG